MGASAFIYAKAASLYRRFATKTLILMYHRVGDMTADPWGLGVSPERFEQQMDVLRRAFKPVRMANLAKSVIDSRLVPGGVAVTFDDGFADNLHNALPALQKHAVPATVYVTSGRIGQQTEFWWDELERIILEPPHLPAELAIETGGESFQFRHEAAALTEPPLPSGSWKAWLEPPATPRQKLFFSLWQFIRRLPAAEKARVLRQVRDWVGLPETGRRAYWPLSTSELRALASSELVEIGAHTLMHPSLPDLSEREQTVEIAESKRQLEEWLGRKVDAFSYPHGNYTPATIRVLQESGFVSSCTTQPIAVTSRSKVYELPRFQVLDWDGDEFERHLTHWLKHA